MKLILNRYNLTRENGYTISSLPMGITPRVKNLPMYVLPITVLLMVLTSCGQNPRADTTGAATELPVVRTVEATLSVVEQESSFSGNVEPYEKAFISSSLPLRINKIHKEVGDFARRGDLLVQMDASNYNQAKIQFQTLETEFQRVDTLFKIGSVSRQQFDQISSQLDLARAAYRDLEANTWLRSPVSGIVTGRFFENGEMFSMSPVAGGRAAILTVEDIDPVKVQVSVPSQYFPRVNRDMSVRMILDLYPGKVFEGSVYLKHPTIDPVSRTFTVELQFPNPELMLRPGMFGRVTLGFGGVERVVVPDLAVQRQQGTNELFVFIENNGTVSRREVTTGRLIGTNYEIINGINPGESVVVAGHSRLIEGSAVRVTAN